MVPVNQRVMIFPHNQWRQVAMSVDAGSHRLSLIVRLWSKQRFEVFFDQDVANVHFALVFSIVAEFSQCGYLRRRRFLSMGKRPAGRGSHRRRTAVASTF